MREPGARRCHGLTLIELMAAIVVISLIAGAVAVRFGSVHQDVTLRSTAAALQELDGRARLAATCGRRLQMIVDTDHGQVRLIECQSNVVISTVSLPRDAAVKIHADGHEMVVYDRTGRSRDYTMELSHKSHSGLRIAWHISGSSGLLHEGDAQ